MHRDIIYNYPSEVEQLGGSDLCHVQGMYAKGRLISVQGHPEFNGDIVAELLERRHNMGIFTTEEYHEAMARATNHHDGQKVAAAFIRFLLED